jgi:hypothetical protein
MAWHGMALMLLAGCGPTMDSTDADIEALVQSLGSPAAQTTDSDVHDLGVVLARGQTITHEFTLRNHSDKPLRLLGAQALFPCCSSVGELPDAVPPLSAIKVPVTFRPGFQDGRKQISFTVTTAPSATATVQYALVAELLSEFQVTTLEGSNVELLVGRDGVQRLRVTRRTVTDNGIDGPPTVTANGGVSAEFVPGSTTTEAGRGVLTVSRELLIALPTSDSPGAKRASIRLEWADGLSRQHHISWMVRPCITIQPGIVFLEDTKSPSRFSIRLRSCDVPFRVLAIEPGPLTSASTLPSRACVEHMVDLVPRLGHSIDSAMPCVRIVTDHPTHATAVLQVVSLAASERVAP